MCGITGFWDTRQATSADVLNASVTKMRDSLIHRGPDGAGNWIDDKTGIALAHRRLAILDLSESGHQPMLSHDQRFVITFNGEIYNHQELKQELNVAGLAPKWRGHSDTEIILAAFMAWGVERALKKFVGMWAIALWDRQEKIMYLSRDRMGEKPLYYGWLGETLVFASELKALRQHHAWNKTLDRDGLDLLLAYNCIPAPYTIYTDIKKLEPGHLLIIDQYKNCRDFVYWDLKTVANSVPRAIDANSAVDILEEKLTTAIKLQMVADVPLGAFLSGGIDSSTIVALMQANSSKAVKTFTIGFDDAAYNEAEQAKAIAKHLGTEHTELYLSPQQTQEIIPSLANFYDEPFADSSQIPTYIVAKLTKQHVTVSLSGDAGDELFAGYNRYKLLSSIWHKIAWLPLPLRRVLANGIFMLPPKNRLLDKMHKLASVMDSADAYAVYNKLISHWDNSRARQLLTDLSHDLDQRPLIEKLMYIDSKRYLPDDILVKVDRAGMAVSLETRIPFLDHRVVEYAWSLPLSLKLHNGQSKWILRQLLKKYVPPALFERPKMGFGVPIDQWLRGPLKEWAHDLLSHNTLAKHNLLDSTLVQNKWREHLTGARNWQYHLWDVLMFQTWYESQHG